MAGRNCKGQPLTDEETEAQRLNYVSAQGNRAE